MPEVAKTIKGCILIGTNMGKANDVEPLPY